MATRLGLKKNWKDSAGVILVSGPFKYARPPTPLSRVITGGENPPFVPLDELGAGNHEWEAVLVKRNSKTGFYANTYVFPGGKLDASDSSWKWRDLFRRCSSSRDPFHPILSLRNPKSPRLPIYGEVPDGPVLGEVAFRICAIRELFEEAGVLLARDNNKVADIIDVMPGTFPPSVKTLSDDVKNYWREKVHSNGEEFLNLCRDLQCVPDIWALVEWSNWLTPRNLHRRYDTVFYLCFSETQPAVHEDGQEIVDAKWFTPSEAVRQFVEKEIKLSPPQFAEINLLRSLGTAPCLHSYALVEMLKNSNYRRSPVLIITKDEAVLSVMNSDDLYPAQGEYWLTEDHSSHPHHPQSPSLSHIHLHTAHNPISEYTCPTHTAQELRDLSDRLSRMEFHKTGEFLFFDTVQSPGISKHLEEYSRVREELDRVKSKL